MTKKLINKIDSLNKSINKNAVSLYKFRSPCKYKSFKAAESSDIVEECRTIKESIEDLAFPQSSMAYCRIEIRNKY